MTGSCDGAAGIKVNGTYELYSTSYCGYPYCEYWDESDVGYSFSISKNNEIPLTYEEGDLVNFPIGTKECRWSASGGAVCAGEYDDPGYSTGANGFCKLVIKKGK